MRLKIFSLLTLTAVIVLTHLLRNVNIPWPTQGMGDGDYLYAFQEVVMPIGYEFDPDLVISKSYTALILRHAYSTTNCLRLTK